MEHLVCFRGIKGDLSGQERWALGSKIVRDSVSELGLQSRVAYILLSSRAVWERLYVWLRTKVNLSWTCRKSVKSVVLRGWLGCWLRCRVIIGATVFKFHKKGKGTKDSKWDAPSSCQLQMVSQHKHLPTPNHGGQGSLSKIIQPEVNIQFPSLWLATQMSYHDYSFSGVPRAKRL